MRILLMLIFFTSHLAHSKVDPPNYDFSLDQFQDFMPGIKISTLMNKYKNSEIVFKHDAFITYKFSIAHLRYRFPIMVQTINGEITDFYARLPYYFLHDIFHQSLINRYGKQDFYQKTEESAIYIWKNQNNFKYIYSGSCTITCFPLFYSVIPVKHNFGDGYKPIIEKMEESLKL